MWIQTPRHGTGQKRSINYAVGWCSRLFLEIHIPENERGLARAAKSFCAQSDVREAWKRQEWEATSRMKDLGKPLPSWPVLKMGGGCMVRMNIFAQRMSTIHCSDKLKKYAGIEKL